jgi:hypothetical protein
MKTLRSAETCATDVVGERRTAGAEQDVAASVDEGLSPRRDDGGTIDRHDHVGGDAGRGDVDVARTRAAADDLRAIGVGQRQHAARVDANHPGIGDARAGQRRRHAADDQVIDVGEPEVAIVRGRLEAIDVVAGTVQRHRSGRVHSEDGINDRRRLTDRGDVRHDERREARRRIGIAERHRVAAAQPVEDDIGLVREGDALEGRAADRGRPARTVRDGDRVRGGGAVDGELQSRHRIGGTGQRKCDKDCQGAGDEVRTHEWVGLTRRA